MYDNVLTINYHNIQMITNEERDIIINICRILNEVEEEHVPIPVKIERQYVENASSVTPWADFNNKENIFNIIGNDFQVIKDRSDKTIIRRHGAKSPHSGYVFKNSGCMYLFSTGTIYPHQKLITPFTAYAIKHFSGDFSRAASDLYTKGYGDRKKPKYPEQIKEPRQFKEEGFPLSVFPHEVQIYMRECKRTLQNSVDYMGCALLWVGSLVVGNSIRMEVKTGWHEISTIWMAIVGGAGLGKSPSISSITAPLEKINNEEIRRYSKAKENWEAYKALSKQEKEMATEVKEPSRTQFIAYDVTIEKLINLHSQNPNGVGVLKDELAGWFKDMNKYKEGSDKEQWLSSWSGKNIMVDRITRESDNISKPILPVLGGIQPTILAEFFTQENKDNGFLDRMLFSFPDLEVENYITDEIDPQLLVFYSEFILMLYKELRKIVVMNEFDEIKPHIARFSDDARIEWVRIFNKITALQNSESTNEFMKSMLAKQKSYIPRFALIINTIQATWEGVDLLTIKKQSVLNAEKLSDYFVAMYEKMIKSNLEVFEVKENLKGSKGSIRDKIKAIHDANPKFNRSIIAKELNVSRITIQRIIKELTV